MWTALADAGCFKTIAESTLSRNTVLALNHAGEVLSTVVGIINCRHEAQQVALSIGAVLKQARVVRRLSAIEVARAAGISAAYLNKLENDAVKRPSPNVLYPLSQALAVPYADLMRLSGYRLPGESDVHPGDTLSAALLAGLTDDEREELLEYLAWYRARQRSGRRATSGPTPHGPEQA